MGEYNVYGIGGRIKDRRNHLKMNQKELAEKVFVDRTTVIAWEKKRSTTLPKIDTLPKLCEVLQCDADYLLGKIGTARNETADVCAYTGLSESSVKVLHENKDEHFGKQIVNDTINVLLSEEAGGIETLTNISVYISSNLPSEKIMFRRDGTITPLNDPNEPWHDPARMESVLTKYVKETGRATIVDRSIFENVFLIEIQSNLKEMKQLNRAIDERNGK